MTTNYFHNPFIRIAGLKSLVIGLLGLCIVSGVLFGSGTHLIGLTEIIFAKDSGVEFYLFEQLINWLLISFFFSFFGLIFSSSKIRFVDIFGTSLLARVPLLISALLRFIPVFQGFGFYSWQMFFIQGVHLISIVWVVILLYNGFKVSSNLKGVKLNASLITSLLMAEIATRLLIQLLT